jgi:hypothetical protein
MLSLDNINEIQDPYQLFLDSLRNKDIKRKYPRDLFRFLKLIPQKIYSDCGVGCPNYNDSKSMANCFVSLAAKDPILVKNIIASFIREEKKLVDAGELNPNTLPNHIKPIHALLDAAGVAIHWKSLYKLYPRPRATEDRAYTREELQKMIAISPDIADKLIIQMFSSAGFRLEAWDYFTWKDVAFFRNNDDSFKGAAIFVYRGDPEQYWTFITPEACETLWLYREKWKSQVGRYPKPDDPLIRAIKYPVVRRLNAKGVRRRIEKIVKRIGLRPPLPEGKKRHDIPLDHGFRKYFNTMMRRAKVNYLDKEDMMGHSVGLERHYERYQEEDFERFPEYQKAIPFLTISDEERLKLENQKLEAEKSELEKTNAELQEYKRKIDELWADKQRMEQSNNN